MRKKKDAFDGRARRMRRILKTSELIARDIILDISERGLKPGDPLPPEAAMLQHYEVGRASLREALRLLEVQGLIHIHAGPKGGPVVGEANADHLAPMLALYFGLSGATYEELAKVLVIFNPIAAELAASAKLSKNDCSMLKASIDQACGSQNSRRTEELLDFHRLVIKFSGNSVWALLADAVSLIFADHIIAKADSRGFQEVTIADHIKIADAILAKKPSLANKHMTEHMERMMKFYRSQAPGMFSQLIEWR